MNACKDCLHFICTSKGECCKLTPTKAFNAHFGEMLIVSYDTIEETRRQGCTFAGVWFERRPTFTDRIKKIVTSVSTTKGGQQ